MRILVLDIDCLRPDHLGCYGYSRATSPNIDRVAASGVRFSDVYASDVPCLPSRTALYSGRFGIHTGVVGHGGTAAEPFVEGPDRGFASRLNLSSWMRSLRNLGLTTHTISSFAERHSAFHFYSNFSEMINPGQRGLESAEVLSSRALDWLERNGKEDDWFLHVHFWDPHTPYRAPESMGNPFAKEDTPSWLSEEVRDQHWNGCGPHSAQEVLGFTSTPPTTIPWNYPRQPLAMDSMDSVRALFDGYDCGVRYADEHAGLILDRLASLGIDDETVVVVTGDHGEQLGEMNVYADHQCADYYTTRVPMILRWPGVTDDQAGRVDCALHYQFDVAASIIELAGGTVPDNWDGESFARSFKAGAESGREELILSQAAWTCQRAVRFREQERNLLWLRTYHDGFHLYPEEMLFDLDHDPHEQHDRAGSEPQLCKEAAARLEQWLGAMMRSASHPVDPMWTVLAEGGPKHVRYQLPAYLERLRSTKRGQHAQSLELKYPAKD